MTDGTQNASDVAPDLRLRPERPQVTRLSRKVLIGLGAVSGLAIAAALIIPVFWFRHYVQDKGQFPQHMLDDLNLTTDSLRARKAGILPYIVLLAGVSVVLVANWFFQLAG